MKKPGHADPLQGKNKEHADPLQGKNKEHVEKIIPERVFLFLVFSLRAWIFWFDGEPVGTVIP